MEKLWYQRFETCDAEKAPKTRQDDPHADDGLAAADDEVGEPGEHPPGR